MFEKNIFNSMNGMMLIMVLILLQLLSIIGLYALQSAWMQIKESQYLWMKTIDEISAEKALCIVESRLVTDLKRCEIPITLTEDLRQKSLEWWQAKTCHVNLDNFHYYYVFEVLEVDPCAYIKVADKNFPAEYYRVTLLGVMNDNKIMLQSTFTLPSLNCFAQCEGKSRFITAGRQMWRKENEL